MSDRVVIDLFVEDSAHEAFLGALIRRLAHEASVEIELRVRSARGGHARALNEFEGYQTLRAKGALQDRDPDILVAGVDGNCTRFPQQVEEILKRTHHSNRDRLVAACPDPHIERWFLADPPSFEKVVGHRPSVGRRKCARDHYKKILVKAIRDADQTPTLGGIEFAHELVAAMDLYRAGKSDRSLKAFVDGLRAILQRFSTGENHEE